ncbi:MAG: sigma-70 family RNA polymerase sigma factor [Clostridia bacterium]|nr:sigma-70 family RNA polymerase sigma factor [Clostridia bacterium]
MDLEALSKANHGLICLIARRYLRLCELNRAADLEDLIQAGHIGVWKAAETFDPNGGKTWAGWAGWHIQREIRALLGVASARRRADLGAVSLNAPLSGDDPDGDTIGDMIADESLPDACEAMQREQTRETVRAAVARLEGPERAVIEWHELHGLSYGALAAETGEAAEALKRAGRRGMNHLRQDMALRAYWLDLQTNFYARKGVRAFNTSWSSVVEDAALRRIGKEVKMDANTNADAASARVAD